MTGLFKCFNRFDSFGFLIEVILEIGILQCSLCCEESYEQELTAGVLKTTKTHQLQIRKTSRLWEADYLQIVLFYFELSDLYTTRVR